MFVEERQQRIVDIVNSRRTVRVSELSAELNTSEVTIRRDLEELQRQNLVVRTHGGAMSAYHVGKAKSFDDLLQQDHDLKSVIAVAAYERINDYDTLLLDNSTTVYELGKLIAGGRKAHLRVITNSLKLIQLLEQTSNCAVFAVGGELNFGYQVIEGSIACRFIKDIRVDKCFFGINGIDETYGFSTPRYEDADIKNQMIESAKQSIVLCDHTKLGKTYLARVKNPDCMITDRPRGDFSYDLLGSHMELVFADKRPVEEENK